MYTVEDCKAAYIAWFYDDWLKKGEDWSTFSSWLEEGDWSGNWIELSDFEIEVSLDDLRVVVGENQARLRPAYYKGVDFKYLKENGDSDEIYTEDEVKAAWLNYYHELWVAAYADVNGGQ